jgi:hypothetical protein
MKTAAEQIRELANRIFNAYQWGNGDTFLSLNALADTKETT